MRTHTVAAALVALGLAATAVPAHASDADTTRLAGADRYATAVAVSRDIFDSANPGMSYPYVDQLTVASGANYPDGLAAGSTANLVGSPLLLVPSTGTIPASVVAEIKRLGVSSVAIAGGQGSISAGVEAQLKALVGSDVVRVAGDDRYGTAAELSAVVDPKAVGTVYLASGENFPDALAASAAASMKDGALLLTRPTALPDKTRAELLRLQPKSVVIAGGKGAVSDAVITAVKAALPGATVTRSQGVDRYQTSAAVSAGAFTRSDLVYLASGEDFPDALAGGAAGALDGAPLLLTRKNCVPKPVLAEINRLGASHFFVVGGEGVLTKNIVNRVPCAS